MRHVRSTTPSISRTTSRSASTLVAVLVAASTAVAAAGPRDIVRSLADEVLAVLRDSSLSSATKRERIEIIADRGVDFATMAKLVLARNLSRFSDAEQVQFQHEFRRHLSVTYGDSVDSYKNEEVVITGDREEARGDVTVKSKIARSGGGDDILVDYRLRQANGDWKIIDFVVEGVSLIANFRSQFQDLLANQTPAQLIALIHEKNQRGEIIGPKIKPKGT
jgi:phospholipid transport system substrate-binding protein